MGTTSQLVVTDEVDVCSVAIPNFPFDVIRTGIGIGPNTTRSRDLGGCVVASRVIQFPIVARSDVGDDRILAVLITSAPDGSRWCGVDLEPGTILLYGSGSEHTEVSPAGLGYSFALIDWESLEKLADKIGLSLRIPEKGAVEALVSTPSVRSLAARLNSRSDPLISTAFEPSDGLSTLYTVAEALAEGSPDRGGGRSAGIDSRIIVGACIEYAESINSAPSVGELCMVAHVSERRLRYAFTATVGVAPVRYFRYRRLNEARRRFIASNGGHEKIGDVAFDLGFYHLGRFASNYMELFGELPSATHSLRK